MERIEKNEGFRKGIFLGYALLSILIGWVITPSVSDQLFRLRLLFFSSGLMDTDAFFLTGIGPAFVNAGMAMIIALIALYLTHTKIGSGEISGLLMIYGYAMYGKTVYNMIPPMLGAYLFAYITGQKLSEKSAVACYATSIGPIVSVLSFHTLRGVFPKDVMILVGLFVGIFAGFSIAFLTRHTKSLLRGNIMYAGGFAAGIAGIGLYSLLKAIGIEPVFRPNKPFMSQELSYIPLIALFILFSYFLIAGLVLKGGVKETLKHMVAPSSQKDYVAKHGFAMSLLTMGIMGYLATLYFMVVPGAQMHGIVYAGIFTVVSFSVLGLTPKFIWPFILGMWIGAFSTGGFRAVLLGQDFLSGALQKIGSRGILMATYVGCGISPITERYGNKESLIMGIIYSVVAPNLSVLHGGLVVYNSGYALAMVVTLFYVTDVNIREMQDSLYRKHLEHLKDQKK